MILVRHAGQAEQKRRFRAREWDTRKALSTKKCASVWGKVFPEDVFLLEKHVRCHIEKDSKQILENKSAPLTCGFSPPEGFRLCPRKNLYRREYMKRTRTQLSPE